MWYSSILRFNSTKLTTVAVRHITTHFASGEIIDEFFVATFAENLLVKNFENLLRIDKVIDRAWCTNFWGDTV